MTHFLDYFQVFVQYGSVHRCSGVIIIPNWVVKVAHCVEGQLDITALKLTAVILMLTSTERIGSSS